MGSAEAAQAPSRATNRSAGGGSRAASARRFSVASSPRCDTGSPSRASSRAPPARADRSCSAGPSIGRASTSTAGAARPGTGTRAAAAASGRSAPATDQPVADPLLARLRHQRVHRQRLGRRAPRSAPACRRPPRSRRWGTPCGRAPPRARCGTSRPAWRPAPPPAARCAAAPAGPRSWGRAAAVWARPSAARRNACTASVVRCRAASAWVRPAVRARAAWFSNIPRWAVAAPATAATATRTLMIFRITARASLPRPTSTSTALSADLTGGFAS